MLLSLLMIVVGTYKSNNFQKILIFFASCGYAFPGTILAVGIVVFVGWLNDLVHVHSHMPANFNPEQSSAVEIEIDGGQTYIFKN